MDHQNVERAFADLNNKYERAKEVVAGFQLSEHNLKQTVENLSSRYSRPLMRTSCSHILPASHSRFTSEEDKYEDTKAEAGDNLAKAGDILADRRNFKAMEIARLTAQLRKAKMNVSSLQGEIEQKVRRRNISQISPYLVRLRRTWS